MSDNWKPPSGPPPDEPADREPPEQSPTWWAAPGETPSSSEPLPPWRQPGGWQQGGWQQPGPPQPGRGQPGPPPQGTPPHGPQQPGPPPHGPQGPPPQGPPVPPPHPPGQNWPMPPQRQQPVPTPPFAPQGSGGQPPYGPPLMGQIPIPRPPGPGRRRRPRRRAWPLVAGVLALVVVLVATTLAFALRGDDSPTDTAGPSPDVSSTPSETPSETPTPTPTLTPTPKPNPRPNPVPRQPTALELVTRNKVYFTGRMLPSRCREPKWRPVNPKATKAYYYTLLPCLNKSWYPTIKKAGVRFRSPKVVVYAGVLRTPCGTERANRGYYCGWNETIYMPYPVDFRNYRTNQVWARVWMAHTFAHEYGHHVQQMTGILDASWRRQRQHRTSAGALQESRRRELQASCFGNVYLGADRAWFPFTGQLLAMWQFTVTHSGDEYSKPRIRDHGGRLNHGWWAKRGFFSGNPGLCNTFTASVRVTN